MASSVTTQVCLMWVYRTIRPVLSVNVLREIAQYVRESYRLIGAMGSEVTVYALSGRKSEARNVAMECSDGTRYCWVSENQAMFVGGGSILKNRPVTSDVYLFNLLDYTVTQQASMSSKRFSPGVISTSRSVLVFGGYHMGALNSCEQFSLLDSNWRCLPDMLRPKYSFSPVLYQQNVYLPCVILTFPELEMYRIYENCFEIYPVKLPVSSNCSLSFLINDVLVLISCNRFIYLLNLTTGKYAQEAGGSEALALSSGPVVVFNEKVYWIEFSTAKLTSFDVNRINLAAVTGPVQA